MSTKHDGLDVWVLLGAHQFLTIGRVTGQTATAPLRGTMLLLLACTYICPMLVRWKCEHPWHHSLWSFYLDMTVRERLTVVMNKEVKNTNNMKVVQLTLVKRNRRNEETNVGFWRDESLFMQWYFNKKFSEFYEFEEGKSGTLWLKFSPSNCVGIFNFWCQLVW